MPREDLSMNTQNHVSVTRVQIHADHAVEKWLGNWTAARTFQVRAGHAQVTIDLRSPQIPAGDIELDLGGAGRRIHLAGQVRHGEVRVQSGRIARLSAIASREYLTDARRAHAQGTVPTLHQKENQVNTAKAAQNTTAGTAGITAGSVTSADGTSIGYLRVGNGPAVVILHGSNESARSHTHLALALADKFTVYLPDRRGRGLSGPHRPDHSMRTEIEDLAAVVAHSRAQQAFGVSVSALIVLQAARAVPAIRQVAVYEPALLMDTTGRYTRWVRRFDQEMARSQVGDALITCIRGLDLAPPAFRVVPRRLLAAATNAAMKKEDAQAAPGTITMRQLAPTLRYEGLLLAEMAGTIAAFGGVPADVLLMGGDMKHPAFIRSAFDALAQTLPHSRVVRFPGLDHGGSADVGPANRGGKPEAVAPEIRSFFARS